VPRRGTWMGCSAVDGKASCSVWSIDGAKEFEGEFLPYPTSERLSAGELRVDAAKTADADAVWLGATWVHAAYLQNGQILIPLDGFNEVKRQLDQRTERQSRHQ
jgi:hypothetical protein